MKWCSVSQIWSKPSSSVHSICSSSRWTTSAWVRPGAAWKKKKVPKRMLLLHGRVGVAPPLAPRAVVDGHGLRADGVQAEREHGRRHARSARRDDGPLEVEAARLEAAAQLLARQERAIGPVHRVIGQVEALRDVAAAKPRAGLRLRAREASSRARVED